MDAERIITRMENAKANFWQWFLTMLGFCFLRRFFDVMLGADPYRIVFSPGIILHYSFWYFALFLAIVLILHFITKERIEKTTKAAFAFWPLILLVPIIDFFFSGGRGYALTYITHENFWREFFSFFGYFGSYHFTYGQTTIATAGLMLVLFYSYFKTLSIIKTSISAFLYYVVGYFYASLPVFFVNELFNFLLIMLLLAEALIWYARYNKKALRELAKNLHLLRAVHYSALLLLGALVFVITTRSEYFNLEKLLIALLVSFFAFQGALGINNLYDRKRIGISLQEYKNLAIIFLLFANILGFFINPIFFLIILNSTLFAVIYSVPPIRFKRFGFWNNLLIGFESALMFAAGFASQEPNIGLMPISMFATIFAIFSIAGNIKDLKDYEEDKKEGIKTLPVILGKERSVKVLALLISACFPLSIAMLGFWNLLLTSAVLGVINGFLLLKFKTEKSVFYCYFAFLLILAIWLLIGSR